MEDSAIFASLIILDIKPASNDYVELIFNVAGLQRLTSGENCTFLGYPSVSVFPIAEHLSPVIFSY